MDTQCKDIRTTVLWYPSQLIDDAELIRFLAAEARGCCADCRFSLLSRLARESAIRAEENYIYFTGEQICPTSNFSALLEMAFETARKMEKAGAPTSLQKIRYLTVGPLNEDLFWLMTKWIMHERECAACKVRYDRLLESAEEFEREYRLAIETGGEVLPPSYCYREFSTSYLI